MGLNHESQEHTLEQPATAPMHALVPTTRQETRAMVVNAIKSAMTEAGQHVGVSVNWLVKHVMELALKPEEVETLVSVQTEFGGRLPHAMKLLYRGLTAEDVYGCYRTQRALAERLEGHRDRPSVTMIAKLIQAFPEADPDNEDLDDMILNAHRIIGERYFWVRHVGHSITILCAIADEYGCATIDAALAMIESRHPKETGLLPEEDEVDEVERHREEYKSRRKGAGR